MSAASDALDAMMARVVAATAKISLEGAAMVSAAAQREAPVKTGLLRRSIDISGPRPIGPASFRTEVGPTVVYGRIRELGGVIRPIGHPFLAFRWEGHNSPPMLADGRILVREVAQEGRFYMWKGLELTKSSYLELARNRWADAIRG